MPLNFGNSKTSESYVLILKLIDKLDLKRGEKNVSLSDLVFITHGKT